MTEITIPKSVTTIEDYTVTAKKNAVPGTVVYYLVVYHTLNEAGYKVITIKAE